jgi:hypothetical protein
MEEQKTIYERVDENNKKLFTLLTIVANHKIDLKSKEFKTLYKEAGHEHKSLMADFKQREKEIKL